MAPYRFGYDIRRALESHGIVCAQIGGVERGPHSVLAVSGNKRLAVKAPTRDEISRVFDAKLMGEGT